MSSSPQNVMSAVEPFSLRRPGLQNFLEIESSAAVKVAGWDSTVTQFLGSSGFGFAAKVMNSNKRRQHETPNSADLRGGPSNWAIPTVIDSTRTHHPPKTRWLSSQAFIETDSGSCSSDEDPTQESEGTSRRLAESFPSPEHLVTAAAVKYPFSRSSPQVYRDLSQFQHHPPSHSPEEVFRPLPLFQSYMDELRSGTAPGKPRFAGVTTKEEYRELVRVRREQDIFKLRKRGKPSSKGQQQRLDTSEMTGDPQRRHILRSGGWELVETEDGEGMLVREAKDLEAGAVQLWVHDGNLEWNLWDIHVRQLRHGGMDRTWQAAQDQLYGCTQSLCRRYVVLCGCVSHKKQSGRHLQEHQRWRRRLNDSEAKPPYLMQPEVQSPDSEDTPCVHYSLMDSTTAGTVIRRPLRRVVLTKEEKLRVVAEKEARPHLTQPELIAWCKEHFGKTPSQPMISKIINRGREALVLT